MAPNSAVSREVPLCQSFEVRSQNLVHRISKRSLIFSDDVKTEVRLGSDGAIACDRHRLVSPSD